MSPADPNRPNDPTVNWRLANPHGILVDEAADAWHSGHVDDLLVFPDGGGLLAATESGGVWLVDERNDALPLSTTWDIPDVKCLALGPDGPRHVFAGCTIAYDSAEKRSYRGEAGSAPAIMESDPGSLAPLLNWRPVDGGLPATAGRVTRIVVIRNLRRIVVACAAVRDGDTGGIFWSQIPPNRFAPGDPPRGKYVWTRATVKGLAHATGFWDLALAATRNEPSRDRLEDRKTITLVAGGFRGGGIAVGQWDAADELTFTRASAAFEDGVDATWSLFNYCGTSSVSSCQQFPTVLYSACAWPDGRLNRIIRSKDGGFNWTTCEARVAGGEATDLLYPLAGDQGAAWGNVVAAHPNNRGAAALGWTGGPFVTFDAGKTWLQPGAGSPHLHADLHALYFVKETPDSIGFLYVGSDGGVARINLDDLAGEQGPAVRSNFNRQLPTLQCYSMAIRQFAGTVDASALFPGVLVAGLQDNGNVTCSIRPTPKPWQRTDGGDGGSNAFAGSGYLHNVMGEVVRATAPLGPDVQVATIPVNVPPDPAGLKAEILEPVIDPTFRNAAGQLLVAIGAPNASKLVYALYANDGVVPPFHWEAIGAVGDAETVSALASFHGDQVLVGTGQGAAYRFDVAAGTRVAQAVKLPKPTPSTQMTGGVFVRIVGFVGGAMFASLLSAVELRVDGKPKPFGTPAVQGYVLRLDGDTWSVTPGAGLPNEYLYGLVAVAAPNTRMTHALLASTDDAVFVSRDEGASWQPASAGLPTRPHGGDLRFVIDRLGGMHLHLGTFGWSMWIAELPSA